MDGFQFIAALVSSLAWPAVVALLLFLLRKQLTGLAERIKELSFPGGKAIFENELQAAKEISEQLADQRSIPVPAVEEDSKLYRFAIEAPDGAIVLAYIELERTLRDIAERLGMGAKVSGQRSIVEQLVKRDLLARDAAGLFDSLRAARNSAAHGVGAQATSQEALEYIRQVNLLIGLLQDAEAKLSTQSLLNP